MDTNDPLLGAHKSIAGGTPHAVQRAQILQHEQWNGKMGTQVSYLEGVQAARCPKDVAVDTTGRAINALLKLAARAALTYFTFGAAGF